MMRKISLVLLGAAIGASTIAVELRLRSPQGGSAVAATADVYRDLHLFGDVF